MEDETWKDAEWSALVSQLINDGIVSWKEVASVVLGELNPPQVGTSLATNPNIKRQYSPRKAWQAVRAWFYAQRGRCENCGTRVKLEVDHKIQKQGPGGIGDNADRLDNLQLICKRCNAKKRPSHKKAGLTTLTAESGLMWILFVKKPKTYEDFKDLCRKYGLTMADIRFQEAWAMAVWLWKEGKYSMNSPTTVGHNP